MVTAAATTLCLSILLGVYMLAASVGLFTDPDRGVKLVDDLERSPGLMYLLAVVAFTVGALIILFHNRWTDPLAIIVTLIGWAALIEGLVLLAFPAIWFGLARPFMRHLRVFAAVTALCGAALIIAGLIGRTPPVA